MKGADIAIDGFIFLIVAIAVEVLVNKLSRRMVDKIIEGRK